MLRANLKFWLAAICLTGIIVMIAAIIVGPAFSPPEFSWIRHSTSEQAGQHMKGAWIIRAGFCVYGGSVAACSLLARHSRPFVRTALAVFGVGLIATAIWSNAPITPGLPSDRLEDWRHSAASWVVGMAFIAACVARLFGRDGARGDLLAWTALVVSVSIPVLMSVAPDFRGVLQRMMFAVSFAFVAREFGVLRDMAAKSTSSRL